MTGRGPFGERSRVIGVLVSDQAIELANDLEATVDRVIDRGAGIHVIIDCARVLGYLGFKLLNIRIQIFNEILGHLMKDEFRFQRQGGTGKRSRCADKVPVIAEQRQGKLPCQTHRPSRAVDSLQIFEQREAGIASGLGSLVSLAQGRLPGRRPGRRAG